MDRRAALCRVVRHDGPHLREIAPEGRVADHFLDRLRGLTWRSSMAPQEALYFPRCQSIHTSFMFMPIDVVFVDATGRIVRVLQDLRPWRVAMCREASAVLELAAGQIRACELAIGDRLSLTGGTSLPQA